jgi:hypothetical protein
MSQKFSTLAAYEILRNLKKKTPKPRNCHSQEKPKQTWMTKRNMHLEWNPGPTRGQQRKKGDLN